MNPKIRKSTQLKWEIEVLKKDMTRLKREIKRNMYALSAYLLWESFVIYLYFSN